MQSANPPPEHKLSCLTYITILMVSGMLILVVTAAAILQPHPPDYLYFTALQSITIHEQWQGLVPVQATYQLRYDLNVFNGTASFVVGTGERRQTANANISIPFDRTQAFLSKLKQSELHPALYQPANTLRSINIRIVTWRETLTLFSQSPGVNRIWGLEMRGLHYMINSSRPAEALAIIEPCLQNELLNQLIADASP